ncbi:unnamed protein product [Clonostachys rosea f. rosea IK726]|jgi:hypothetical protein|uniref:Uncharacterized protein n=1 Tax=Clonostachys rosea f. rosea IK726 TaxID=1349383 RepID=A0ACA9TU54_BIOOC|nr:unnamed protein product [Clonostachys rosea f. rosea IK726]
MEPIVIADSDGDDDEVHSPPFNHIEPPIEGHVELAGASDSTDPSFFKNVFNEHFQAAIDPLQAAELNRYGEEDELSHEFFDRGNQPDPRVAEPMAEEPDPWEIPSSPENPPKMMGFQSKKSRASGGMGNASPTRNGPDDVDDEGGNRRGKKRRLNHRNAPEEIPSQDPLAQSMPHDDPESQRPAPDQSSMFPPTLPLPSRLVVAPDPLTNNQRMEYHSVDPQSSDLLSQDQGPALPRQIGAFERSSGSATNINTPRSQFVPSRSQDLDFSEPGPQRVLTFNTPDHMDNQERELPPLIGTAPPPRPASPPEIPHLAPVMEKPVASYGPDELAAEPVTTSIRKENEKDESEFEDSFAQPKKKKKRGRPKKETAQKATAEAVDSQIIEPSKEATPSSGAKKKRGRPKKSDQQGTEPKAADINEVQDVKPVKTKAKKKAPKSPDISKQDHEEGQGAAEECKNEEIKADCAADIDQARREMPDTIEKKGAAHSEEPEHEKAETKSHNDEKPPERPSKGKQATASPAKSLFSPGIPTKASYRVGLSKRSRVAPLLKIVRKDTNGR